jgi:hypothetical protein
LPFSCAERDKPQNAMIRNKKLILNDMNINFGLVHSKNQIDEQFSENINVSYPFN